MAPIIALLTDFGEVDPYVGIMKGVIRTIAPMCSLLDISHQIPLGGIRRAAFAIWQSSPYFPEGTVFLCVIDPGVGTARKPVIVQDSKHIYIGPDNGMFTYLKDTKAWELSNPKYQLGKSTTFHGRDIFAPAAAHVANGISPQAFGNPVPALTRFTLPRLVAGTEGMGFLGEILHADRFGNLITSLGQLYWENEKLILDPWVGNLDKQSIKTNKVFIRLNNGERLPLVKTFADISSGNYAGLIGSTGLVEIVANKESAEELSNLRPGDPVQLMTSY